MAVTETRDRVADLAAGERHEGRLAGFQGLGEGLLQGAAELAARYVLIGGKREAKNLVLRHVAALGVIVGHALGFRHSGVIDDDDFVAGLCRAQGTEGARGQGRQGD